MINLMFNEEMRIVGNLIEQNRNDLKFSPFKNGRI